MELIDGDLKVEFIDIGEGWCGDYNPDDSEDEELLRFYVSRRGRKDADEEEWIDLDDGSYCTAMPVSAPEDIQRRALDVLMREARDSLEGGGFKKTMEWMSWISLDDFPPLDSPHETGRPIGGSHNG